MMTRRAIGCVPAFTGVVTKVWFYKGEALTGWKFHIRRGDGAGWHADEQDIRPVGMSFDGRIRWVKP